MRLIVALLKYCVPIDDNFVSVKQNKHIKVEGTYNGGYVIPFIITKCATTMQT